MESAELPINPADEQFRNIANLTPALIWVADVKNERYFFNTKWLKLTGRTLEQETGAGWTKSVHPDDLQECLGTIKSAFRLKKEYRIEYRIKVANGEYLWMLEHAVPLLSASGKFNGYMGSCMDVNNLIAPEKNKSDSAVRAQQMLNEELAATNEELNASNEELFKTQQNLQTANSDLEERVLARTRDVIKAHRIIEQEKDRLTRFFMQAPAGICMLGGENMVFEMLNPLYQQLFPGRRLLGKPLLDAIPELRDEPVIDELRNVYRTGVTFEGKELHIPLVNASNGKLEDRYFNFIYQARLDGNGRVDGILVFVFEVTDAILSRRRIEESETSLRSLVMTSHYTLMIMKGRDYVVEIANQQLANLWNKTLDEITGRPLLEILPELEGQPFPRLLQGVYDTAIPYGQEEEALTLQTPEGIIQKYVSFYYDPIVDNNGAVTGIIVAAEDITEKVQSRKLLEESNFQHQQLNDKLSSANEEFAALNEELTVTNEELLETHARLQKTIGDLQESENRVQSIVASAPFPIGVYAGKEMKIIMANQSIIDVWGKGNNVVGQNYSEILPELENQEIFSQLDSVYTTGVAFHARNQRLELFVNGKSRIYYFNYSFTPLFDAVGNVYGVMNTAADVTDLNVAKQKVEQNEQNLYSMILQAPVAMCILLGPNHVVEVANNLMIKLWGKGAPENVNKKPIFEALPDVKGQGIEELLANVYEKGETFVANEMPTVFVRNGVPETVYQNFVYQPYKNADGETLGVIAITIDVTEQVLARQKLEDSEAELLETKRRLELELEAGKQVQRKKDDFIGMASHELKTPLTSLSAIVQVASSKLKNSNDVFLIGAMDKANMQVKRMSSMINGFLDISRLESGKIRLEKRPFDIDKLVEDVIDETKLIMSSHTIHFEPCGNMEVYADPDKISSVVSNLISNAIKYSPKGKNIDVRCSKADGMMVISVKDEGMGISQTDKEKLFERYFRVESNNTKHIAGFGIGLYLSAEIVQLHNGKIWVESEAGSGSTFYFSLPLLEKPE